MSSFCRLVIGQFINGTLLRAPVGGGGSSGGHGVQKAVNHVLPKGESGTGTSSLPRPTTSHNGNPSHNTQDDNSSSLENWRLPEKPFHRQSHQSGRHRGNRNEGSWFRTGPGITAAGAVIGLTLNFFHDKIRILAVRSEHGRYQKKRGHLQMCKQLCVYSQSLGIRETFKPTHQYALPSSSRVVSTGPPTQERDENRSLFATLTEAGHESEARSRQPPSLKDLEELLDYDPLIPSENVFDEEESRTKPEAEGEEKECVVGDDYESQVGVDDEEASSAFIDLSKIVGEDRNSLAAVENEMLAIADTHQGVRLVMAGQREQGIDLLLRAARMGSSEAMYNLGVIYQQDGKERRAARFYQAASEMGYAAAFFNLGIFHQQGKAGLEPSTSAAVEMYKKAAELGLEEAVVALEETATGIHDERQKEDQRNERVGRANQMSADDLFRLARAYHYGLTGITVDKHYAAELYRLASKKGHRKSKRAYTKLLQEFLDKIQKEDDDDISNGRDISIAKN